MTNIIALAEGTSLVGDYIVERVLGAGGFGITYLARETALDRLVTIKEYFPSDFAARKDGLEAVPRSLESTPDYTWGLERFVAEAQTLARFNHPHIVGVHRYFRANNTAYMVLHYEEGQSLKNWLKNLGRVPRQADLDKVIAPLLDALEVIHEADFLHRDIAPDNIIVRKNGQPVLIDFGSARGEIAHHSKTISALVKPGYSPYEQYAEKNSRQGPWTDIYALGATLYYAITKKRPPDSILRVTKDEYRSCSESALGAYRKRFMRAIDKALAVDINSRPQSVAAWRGELLAPDEPKRSWLTGRPKRAESEPALDPLSESPDEDSHSEPEAHAPPPPDTPGRRGGMLDFVDKLKKPNQRPLAEALRGEAQADTALKTDPAAKSPEPDQSAAAAGPAPGVGGDTVRVDPPAPTPLFPRRKAAAARKAAPQEARRAPDPPSREPHRVEPSARVDPVLPLPVAYEPQRRPPRPPGADLLRRGARLASGLVKLVLIGALAFGLYTYREHLPSIDVKALTEQLARTDPADRSGNAATGAPSTGAQSQPTAPRQAANQTGSIEPQRPAERIRMIRAHDGPVKAVAYDDSGRRIVTVGNDGTLRVWFSATGELERIVNMDHGQATALAVRGRYAATGHQSGHAAVWDLDAGTKIADLRRNEAPIWAVAFTRSGRLATASHDWSVSLWDIRKPSAPVHVFEDHKNPVQAMALAPDTDILASGGADKQLRLWDLNTLDKVRTYRSQSDFITAIAFSADSSLVASGTLSGQISLFRAKSRSRLRRISGHDGEISALAFTPDNGLLVSASNDGTVRVRETRRWRTIKTLPDHRGPVTALAIAPDGRSFATSGADGTVRVWATAAFAR